MKWFAGVALVLALAGCAPDAGAATQRVEVPGVVTEIMASGDLGGWVLDVNPYGVLPLDFGDLDPVEGARGVVVDVPESVQVPEDAEGRFAALNDYVGQSGEPLRVVALLDG